MTTTIIDLSSIESSKENIVPLKKGRDAKKLFQAIQSQSSRPTTSTSNQVNNEANQIEQSNEEQSRLVFHFDIFILFLFWKMFGKCKQIAKQIFF